jgi:hypothetical protein
MGNKIKNFPKPFAYLAMRKASIQWGWEEFETEQLAYGHIFTYLNWELFLYICDLMKVNQYQKSYQ